MGNGKILTEVRPAGSGGASSAEHLHKYFRGESSPPPHPRVPTGHRHDNTHGLQSSKGLSSAQTGGGPSACEEIPDINLALCHRKREEEHRCVTCNPGAPLTEQRPSREGNRSRQQRTMLKLFVCTGAQAETKAGFQKRSSGEQSRSAVNASVSFPLGSLRHAASFGQHNSASVPSIEVFSHRK